MKIRRLHVLLLLLVLCVCAIPFRGQLRRPVLAVIQIMKGMILVSGRNGWYRTQFGGNAVTMRFAAFRMGVLSVFFTLSSMGCV